MRRVETIALCTGVIHSYVASYALSKMDFSITTIYLLYSWLFPFLLFGISCNCPRTTWNFYMEFLFLCPEEAKFFFWKFQLRPQFTVSCSDISLPCGHVVSVLGTKTQQALLSALVIIAVYVPAKEWEHDEFAVPRCLYCAVDRLPSSGRWRDTLESFQ